MAPSGLYAKLCHAFLVLNDPVKRSMIKIIKEKGTGSLLF